MFSKKMNERSSKLALICFVEVRNVVNFSGCVFERESEQGTEVVLMCVEEVTCADLCLDVCGRVERCIELVLMCVQEMSRQTSFWSVSMLQFLSVLAALESLVGCA